MAGRAVIADRLALALLAAQKVDQRRPNRKPKTSAVKKAPPARKVM
jgi:hypothetical protein